MHILAPPSAAPRALGAVEALKPVAARAALALLLTALWPAPAGAQIFENIGIRAQGMSGAFVSVSNDATATWWNPAGLASSGFLNLIYESDRTEDPSDTRARAFALTVPSLGISYYRLSLSGMRLSHPIDLEPTDREDEGALNQFGVTVGQSLGSHLVIATTAKLVNALGDNHGDLDAGAIATFGRARLGIAAKNLWAPDFSDGVRRLDLPRQVRGGASFSAGAAPNPELVVAVDADLTTTPTVFGDARHVAVGAETWLFRKTVGARAGVGWNTVGEHWRSGSIGGSAAIRTGIFIDAQLTRGDDLARNGWGLAFRLTF